MADKWIYVTPTDIKNGEVGNCAYCPIAQAVKRKFNSNDVWVYPETMYVGNVRYEMPRTAAEFIVAYDDHQPVQPIRFKLPTGVELARH